MYSDVFCKVYNELGWNYYPEIFGQQLLIWLKRKGLRPQSSLDMGCGTGILCQILHQSGVPAVAGMDLSEGMIRIARENGPEIDYGVADMVTYRPERTFDLVTCTGDALNHIESLGDVGQIFRNVYDCLNPGGYFIFDILNENEISTSEPFEMDFSETVRVGFQMTQPEVGKVNLKIRVFENGDLQFEENIRETVHDPARICQMLRERGFSPVTCADRLLGDDNPGTTWFVIAKKS